MKQGSGLGAQARPTRLILLSPEPWALSPEPKGLSERRIVVTSSQSAEESDG